MTGKERVQAALTGEQVDRKPRLLRRGRSDDSDIWVIPVEDIQSDPEKVVLAEVPNPYSRSTGLNELLQENPDDGNARLQELVEETKRDIEAALAAGADGIFYVLKGAAPEECTPMQYGGFYLERDRELLSSVEGTHLIVVSVEGGADAYVDFVSDLPTDVFACHSSHVALLRDLGAKPVAANCDESDITLIGGSNV